MTLGQSSGLKKGLPGALSRGLKDMNTMPLIATQKGRWEVRPRQKEDGKFWNLCVPVFVRVPGQGPVPGKLRRQLGITFQNSSAEWEEAAATGPQAQVCCLAAWRKRDKI